MKYTPHVVAALGLFLFLGSITAFHADEVWVFVRIDQIRAGARPLAGMMYYTGALQQYLLWPLAELFGDGVWVLRGLSAAANLLGIILLLRLVRALEWSDRERFWLGMVVATSPAFLLFARFGIELNSLTLPLVFGGLLCTVVGARTETLKARVALGLTGGLLIGLSVYNHVLLIVLPAAFGPAALAVYRGRLLKHPVTWALALGFLVGWAPQLVTLLAGDSGARWGEGLTAVSGSADAIVDSRLLGELPHLPSILAGIWDGSILYDRFVGGAWVWVLPYPILAVLGLLVARLRGGDEVALEAHDKLLLLGLPLMVLGTVLIAPGLSLRFLRLPVLLLGPWLLVRLARPLWNSGVQRRARLATGLLAAVVALNVVYVTSNYYVRYAATGGAPAIFDVGANLVETSNTFMPVDQLYRELVDAGVEVAFSHEKINYPLHFARRADGGDLRLEYLPMGTRPPPNVAESGLSAVVIYYNGPEPWNRGTRLFDPTDLNLIDSPPTRYVLDPAFDSRYRVYRAEPSY